MTILGWIIIILESTSLIFGIIGGIKTRSEYECEWRKGIGLLLASGIIMLAAILAAIPRQ